MTDRELLEAAAKAAGLVIDKSPCNGGGAGNDGFDILGNAMLDWHNNKTWNPLTDDGDALRLAVRLRITPNIDCNMTEAEAATQVDGGFFAEPHIDDPYAATRRAIVRAAAASGK